MLLNSFAVSVPVCLLAVATVPTIISLMQRTSPKDASITVYMTVGLAVLLGGGSMVLLGIFLVFGSFHKVPVLNHLVAMLILMLIGYTLIRIGVRYQLLQQRSLMPAIFFMLFTASLPAARQVSPALIGSLFYLFSKFRR